MGVGKKDAEGNHVSLESDVRSIVLGLVWYKIVFKYIFNLDISGIRERFGDKQLALIRNGIDIMIHMIRIWIDHNRSHASAVLLQKDVRNAFNEIRSQEFLKDCRDYAPASSRFAHYCYGDSSHLVYAGALESCHRGHSWDRCSV